MRLFRYMRLAIFILSTILVVRCSLNAQSWRAKIRYDCTKLLENADSAYLNYNFNLTKSLLQSYRNKLKKIKDKPSLQAEYLQKYVDKAMKLEQYAEAVIMLDSVLIHRDSLSSILPRLAPIFEEQVKLSSDSSSLKISYQCSLNGISIDLYQNKNKNYDLYRTDNLLNGDYLIESLHNINTHLDENAPFILSDGYTLLFSRKSEIEGLGGYDLYYARYNSEDESFYKPKLIGFPFNSPANDYCLIYDDIKGLTYLLSDRYCPNQYVCLYLLNSLPKDLDFSKNKEQDEKLTADINFLKKRNFDSKKYLVPHSKKENKSLNFQIKKGLDIAKLEDFQSIEAKSLFQDYLAAENRLKSLLKQQKELRVRYKNGEKDLHIDLETIKEEINMVKKLSHERLVKSKNLEIEFRK